MGRSYNAADAIGYAVPKDIRNRPLREIDYAGQRRMWGSTLIVVIFLALVLGAIWVRSEQISLGYQIESLQAERSRTESERRHLVVELETLRSPQRIEALATNQLHLVAPAEGDAFVIERVRSSAAPSNTTVARR